MPRATNAFTFIDLFAGIGGFRAAFDAVGGRCVFTSEWNRFCQETYAANYNTNHPMVGDITAIQEQDIPDHDVLVAGFPCQPFSIAGVSKKNALQVPHGFECQTQGTLFFDIARIINFHRPKAFLLENVKNLKSHNKGQTFEVIMHTLTEELGYHVDWKIIDAQHWVPQHRERVFIVGFREPSGFSFDGLVDSVPEVVPTLGNILHPEDGSEVAESPYTEGKMGHVSSKYTLTQHLWGYLQNYAEKHRQRGNGFGYGLFGPGDVARTLSSRYYKDGAEILIRQKRRRPRRLTPRECARLMGFDQARESSFIIPVSDAQAYRQFGNAVAAPVALVVAKQMLPWIVPKPTRRRPRPSVGMRGTIRGDSTEQPHLRNP